MNLPSTQFDAIVIGGRCAGAATAMLLGRRGLRVLLVDRDAPGDDALSTHALMRAGVLQLHRWGLLPAVIAAGTPVIRGATFHYGADEMPVPIKPRGGVAGLYAPRRIVLDPILVAAARTAGAVVRHRVRVIELVRTGARVVGVVLADASGATATVMAPMVVGADGIGSLVARRVGAGVERTARHASGVIYAHWEGVTDDHYHWYNAEGASSGLIPTGGAACIFVATPADRYRTELHRDLAAGYRRVLAETAPGLAARLPATGPGKLHAFAGVRGYVRTATGPGWALVGDAGYFKDPITAHGMTDALRDAELLADAIADGSAQALARYQEERDQLSRDVFEVTDEIAAYAWSLDELRGLHLRLNAAMVAEVTHLSALPALAASVPRASRAAELDGGRQSW